MVNISEVLSILGDIERESEWDLAWDALDSIDHSCPEWGAELLDAASQSRTSFGRQFAIDALAKLGYSNDEILSAIEKGLTRPCDDIDVIVDEGLRFADP